MSDDDDGGLRIDRSIRTLRELALEQLRNAIVTQYFRPGDRLVERQLCEKLGVSRTVVREVLRHLETEGLVRTLDRRGPEVARPSEAEAAQIYELRALLEAAAAAACARDAGPETRAALREAFAAIEAAHARREAAAVLSATRDFYSALFEGGGKAIAWGIVESLNARISFLRALTIASPGRERRGPAELRAILEAVLARDPEAAAAAVRRHIASASAIARDLLRQG